MSIRHVEYVHVRVRPELLKFESLIFYSYETRRNNHVYAKLKVLGARASCQITRPHGTLPLARVWLQTSIDLEKDKKLSFSRT